MALPDMPIRADRRTDDRDDGSEYDTSSGWWEPKPPSQSDE